MGLYIQDNIIRKTLRVCSVMFSWTFPPLVFRAGCRSAIYVLTHIYFDRARTPTEARRAAPRLGLYIQDNDVHGGVPCVPPLCIVFLDFRSRFARGRSATFRRSSARQSARRLPHRALCALRRITAYLHKAQCVDNRRVPLLIRVFLRLYGFFLVRFAVGLLLWSDGRGTGRNGGELWCVTALKRLILRQRRVIITANNTENRYESIIRR